MRFLSDENVEQPVVEALRAAGHDVLAMTEERRGLQDDEVLPGLEGRLHRHFAVVSDHQVRLRLLVPPDDPPAA